MSGWLKVVLAALGLGAGSFAVYKFVPLPGMNKLGVGTVVTLRTLGRAGFSNLGSIPIQITGKGSQPGTYESRMGSRTITFHPADIWSVVQRAPSIPILAGCE